MRCLCTDSYLSEFETEQHHFERLRLMKTVFMHAKESSITQDKSIHDVDTNKLHQNESNAQVGKSKSGNKPALVGL